MSYDEFRAQFVEARCHHVVVAGFLDETGAEPLRAQVNAAPFSRYAEPDRGHYEHNRELAIPTLFDDLRAIAEELVERPLRVERACWVRMRHRDYELMKGDARDRIVEPHLELTLDLSARATDQAEVVYTDGSEAWPIPQVPGAIAIVAREPRLYRYTRYLNVGVGDAVVERLRLSLSYSR